MMEHCYFRTGSIWSNVDCQTINEFSCPSATSSVCTLGVLSVNCSKFYTNIYYVHTHIGYDDTSGNSVNCLLL